MDRQSHAVYKRYVPHLRETRRQVGARGCVERVVQSAQVGARSQGASSLPPDARPSLRCAGNQTPLTHSATTLYYLLSFWIGLSRIFLLASRQAIFICILLTLQEFQKQFFSFSTFLAKLYTCELI